MNMVLDIIEVSVFVVMLLLSANIIYSFLNLAPWVPTPKKELERINRLADLKPGETFYEIGCGTAVVSSFIAKNNPEVKVVGIELALPVFLAAKILNHFKKPANLKIEFGDAFSKNYSDADVVYIYGLPVSVNGKLRTKLEKELKPGARFISYAFTLNEWKGTGAIKDKPTPKDVSVNIYTK